MNIKIYKACLLYYKHFETNKVEIEKKTIQIS